MSPLVIGQRGKRRKLEDAPWEELFAKQLMCLRLAVLLCHARKVPEYESLYLSYKAGRFRLTTNPSRAKRYPKSAPLLDGEVLAWQNAPGSWWSRWHEPSG